MRRGPRFPGFPPARVTGPAVLALVVFAAGFAGAQVLDMDVKVLENAALRKCKTCAAGDPELLISEASAAIRMDQDDDGKLFIRVIPLRAKGLSVSQITVDGVEAELDEGNWTVRRAAKTKKKAPKIEVVLDDGQALSFKPQHRPFQGPVGGLIMPKSEERPEADLSFHKKSFWADSLG